LLFDPWGKTESQWGVSLDSTGLGWKGLLREPGSGLSYARARWYDSQSRSFISEDPIGIAGSINTYAFGGNDPVNNRDPTGRQLEGMLTWANPATYGNWLFFYSVLSGMLGGRGGIGESLSGTGRGGGGSGSAPSQMPIQEKKPTYGQCLSDANATAVAVGGVILADANFLAGDALKSAGTRLNASGAINEALAEAALVDNIDRELIVFDQGFAIQRFSGAVLRVTGRLLAAAGEAISSAEATVAVLGLAAGYEIGAAGACAVDRNYYR
jgi:RHS repeat-associated protein